VFEGFSQKRVETNGVAIHLVQGGNGPPVLFLHGYPQTHVCWHAVAPRRAERFTIVCPDLRGYGDSDKPPSDPSHYAYSKRIMAADQVELMKKLGFERFAVVGHDRGARVAHRMALDHSATVSRVALLDIVPTAKAFAGMNQKLAAADYHWFFLIQPDELPERLIGDDPYFYLRWTFDHWSGTPGALTHEAIAEYRRCFNAETIRATCEDYRAGTSVDLEHDDADSDSKIACPLLLLWSRDGTGAFFDVLSVWREAADAEVSGRPLDCGHFLAEERPEEVALELLKFLSE